MVISVTVFMLLGLPPLFRWFTMRLPDAHPVLPLSGVSLYYCCLAFLILYFLLRALPPAGFRPPFFFFLSLVEVFAHIPCVKSVELSEYYFTLHCYLLLIAF